MGKTAFPLVGDLFLVEGRDDDRKADFGPVHPRQYIIWAGKGQTGRPVRSIGVASTLCHSSPGTLA
jgi:hypothetical protein